MHYFVVLPQEELTTMLQEKGVVAKGGEPPISGTYESKVKRHVLVADINEGTANQLRNGGAQVYPNIQFEILDPRIPGQAEARYWEGMAPMLAVGGLADVTRHVRADEAWKITQGQNVTIAVIDTGIA